MSVRKCLSLAKFCHLMPKVELHAHLNGSLSEQTLRELRNMSKQEDKSIDDALNYMIREKNSNMKDVFILFKVAHALMDNEEAVKFAMKKTLIEFHEDGVVLLELRSTPKANSFMSKRQYVEAMISGLLDCEDEIMLAKNTCLILSIDRRNSLEEAMDTIQLAIEMNIKYPHIIRGIDVSGDPAVGSFSTFVEVLNKARSHGLSVTIHIAEIPNEDEIFDIIKWKPNRLGHATCVVEHNGGSSDLWNTVLESKIPIELCLTSNIKCGSVKTYEQHHFKDFFQAGHPVSIATDDKGVFDTSLTNEHLLCAQTFDLTKEQLWKINLDAISFSFSPDEIKKRVLNYMVACRQNLFS